MFYLISTALVLVLVILNKGLNMAQSDNEKLSPFECGILEIGDARQRFDISFYVIAILFLIFDLEVILLVPYASTLFTLGWFGYWSFILLMIILTIGLVYELASLSLPKAFFENKTP